jgi:hypothetical protein
LFFDNFLVFEQLRVLQIFSAEKKAKNIFLIYEVAIFGQSDQTTNNKESEKYPLGGNKNLKRFFLVLEQLLCFWTIHRKLGKDFSILEFVSGHPDHR